METQRLRAAVELAADTGFEVEQRAPRNAANGPMTAPVATRCEAPCGYCPGKARKWLKWGLVVLGAIVLGLIVAIVALAAAPDVAPLCQYEGRSFSVGSLIVVPGNQGRECRESEARNGASWYPVRIE